MVKNLDCRVEGVEGLISMRDALTSSPGMHETGGADTPGRQKQEDQQCKGHLWFRDSLDYMRPCHKQTPQNLNERGF